MWPAAFIRRWATTMIDLPLENSTATDGKRCSPVGHGQFQALAAPFLLKFSYGSGFSDP